eukprot:sb/3475471/
MHQNEAQAQIRPNFCVRPFGLTFGHVIWVKKSVFCYLCLSCTPEMKNKAISSHLIFFLHRLSRLKTYLTSTVQKLEFCKKRAGNKMASILTVTHLDCNSKVSYCPKIGVDFIFFGDFLSALISTFC